MEIIRKIVKVGNGAGVILPRNWYGGEARVELVRRPIDLENDVFNILKPYLHDILGVYLAGSYSRKEESDLSDVDILAISGNINERISSGKYNVMIVSLDRLKKSIRERALPFYPMIQEAKAIINRNLLDELKSVNFSREAIVWNIETTESSLKFLKNLLESDETASGGIIYTLVFRLRSLYILKQIIEGKKYACAGFLKMLSKNKVDEKVYEMYRMEKLDRITKPVGIEKAQQLYNLIDEFLEEIRCLIRKK